MGSEMCIRDRLRGVQGEGNGRCCDPRFDPTRNSEQSHTGDMANKPWFQANIHAPGTGFALLVIAFCLLIQTIPSAICVLTPRNGWDPPLSPERVRYCKGG